MALVRGRSGDVEVMEERFALHHVYDKDEEGNDSRLAIAQGDSISKAQVEKYGLKEGSDFATASSDYDKNRMLEIAEDNARIQQEERSKDAAARGLSPEDVAALDIPRADTAGGRPVEAKDVRGPKEPGKRSQDEDNPAVDAGMVNPEASKTGPGMPSPAEQVPKSKRSSRPKRGSSKRKKG
jgi:hypothetical protein